MFLNNVWIILFFQGRRNPDKDLDLLKLYKKDPAIFQVQDQSILKQVSEKPLRNISGRKEFSSRLKVLRKIESGRLLTVVS